MTRRLAGVVLAIVVVSWSAECMAEEFVNPKANIPPKATPQRRNAGEGVPPLPLPATPLRRSERKREPAPPALVGNVTFSDLAARKAGVRWETTIIDLERWVSFTNDALTQRYRFVNTDFGKFSYDPTELPILYFTGWKSLPHFDDGTIQRMQQYLMDGGTWVVHSNCGRPEFNSSFRQEIRRIFPQRELAPVATDHPIYSSFYKIKSMKVREGKQPWKIVPPYLEVINIGTRAAVIFSPIDLSCGWNADANPIEGGILYDQADALKLGSNIMTYCLAEYQYGRFFAHAKVYHQAADATRDQLVLAQIKHNGDWNPTPHGLPNLLKTIDQSTTLHVQFKCVEVEPDKDDIFAYPVLYMTGLRKFTWDEKTRQRLRQYLDNGGVLLADCAIGSREFDEAFRAQIAQIYKDRKLTQLPSNHPLLSFIFDVRTANLAPLARQLYGTSRPPLLEVIEVEGTIPVIYSPLSLSAGWEQLPRAYDVGYADEDALKLGVNILMYEVSH